MKEITLYRDDFKTPLDGVPEGWTFFDDTLVSLGVEKDKTENIDEVTITVEKIQYYKPL